MDTLSFRFFRTAAAALMGAALLGGSLPASSQPTARIEQPAIKAILGWTFIASQLPLVYGVDKGFFKEEGLDVTLDRGAGSGVALQRVASGVYQFGYSDIGTLARYDAENRSRPLQAVYVVEDDSPLALFTLQSSGITKPGDIAGKRMGVSQFDGARQMLPVLAKKNSIDLSTVQIKTVDAQLREVMLARGEVDAITGFTITSVNLLNALKQKFTVIRYRDFGVDGLGEALVVAPEFARQNPNTVRAFVRALNRSVKAILQNPEEAIAVLKARDPLINAANERSRLDLLVTELILTPNTMKQGLSNVAPQRLDGVIRDVLETTEDKAPLAAETVYTDKYLPSQADRIPPAYHP